MDTKPIDEVDRLKDDIYALAMSPLIATALNSMLSFGIPKLLETPKTIDELSQATHSVKHKIERTLLALEAFGYFSYDEGAKTWSNSSKTVLFLDKNFHDAIYFCCVPFQYEMLLKYSEALRCDQSSCYLQFGRNIYEELSHRSLDNNYFHTGLGAYTRMGGDDLFSGISWAGLDKVLDAGGGDATMLCELAKRNSHIEGAVLDISSLEDLAVKNIDHYGLNDRVKFLPGDFRQDIPSGYDCIIFKQTLNSWSDEVALKILENCYKALENGKKLIVIEHALVKTDENYREVRYLDLMGISEIESRTRNLEEFKTVIENAGFTIENIKRLSSQYMFEAIKSA